MTRAKKNGPEKNGDQSAAAVAVALVRVDRIFGTGEMADLTRALDWAHTPLGPVEQWPDALLVTVNMLLASRHAMFLWWGDELVQFYNDSYRRSLREDKHPKALGQRGRECWPEIWPIVAQEIDKVMTLGEANWNEDQLIPIYRDGKLEDVYWTYSYSPVRDVSGRICGTLVTCTETTTKFLAERRIRVSQEQYQALFELASDAVFVADLEGRIQEVNLAACHLLDYDRAELLRRSYSNVVSEAELPRLWKSRDQLRSGGVSVEEWQLVTRSGSPIIAEVSATILPDGRWQAFVRDITERKRLERERLLLMKELEQERERLSELFQQAPAFVAVLRGPEHVYEMTNPPYQELIGQRNVIGKSVLKAVPEAEEQGFIAMLDRVYKTGEPLVGRGARINLARSAGQPLEERYVDFVYQPVREADGTVSGIIALGVDMTEGRRAQEALLQTEKLAAVGRLASSIAHEINNPLEAVTNLLYLARETAINHETREYLMAAEHELRRVSAITNQTLRFHKQATNPRSASSEDLLDGSLSIYHGRLINSHVVVERRLRAAAPVMCFDGEIQQVLSNLIGNAIDALPSAGGRLLIRSREGTHWKTGQEGLIMTVADTGSGMSPETLTRIYEPFFSTKGDCGTGLGLWISKGIVERHRGALAVRSSQRKGHCGTVFTLFLPRDAVNRGESSGL